MTHNLNVVTFYRDDDRAILPNKHTKWAAGLDLYSIESVILNPNDRVLVSTGLCAVLPANTYGKITSRSGLAFAHGLDVAAGTVDSDYTGVIKVLLCNNGRTTLEIPEKTRIAQLIIVNISHCRVGWVSFLLFCITIIIIIVY